MAPQGRFGATAGAAAVGAGLAALWAVPTGAAGAACLLTLLDCCPTDLPPPIRLAASALMPDKAKVAAKIKVKIFMMSPKNYLICSLLST
jgi:hypothetical protein